jgi:phosphoenolpyruvate carboxylase
MEATETRDAPLRRNVRLLGDLLGRVLVEQEGESLLEDVERVRALARDSRAGAPHEALQQAGVALARERPARVLRACGL